MFAGLERMIVRLRCERMGHGVADIGASGEAEFRAFEDTPY